MKQLLQKIGTGLLIGSLVTLFLEKFLITYILLTVVLGLDIWSIQREEETISQWFHDLFPGKIDRIITIIIPLIFVFFHSPIVGLYFIMGTLHGHLNFNW